MIKPGYLRDGGTLQALIYMHHENVWADTERLHKPPPALAFPVTVESKGTSLISPD